jgi:N-hydroxyarylamine O-acetyltransferase
VSVFAVLDETLTAAYLRRLGLEHEPATAEALQRLHRRHVERVPYETLWIHSGENWGLDPIASTRRIALEARGGYCYHLNGAFAELLDSLGYEVHRHVGGVHGPDGPDAAAAGNHLVLTVTGLMTETNDSEVWYVDVGLGDALYEPIPLHDGEYRHDPFTLQLSRSQDAAGGWRLKHDPKGGFPGMAWTDAEAAWGDFAAQHDYLSTASESGFVRIGMAQCRDATGVDVVRGLIVMRVGADAHASEPLTDRAEWFAALREFCGLHFDATPPEVLDRLWSRTLANHRSWEAEQS